MGDLCTLADVKPLVPLAASVTQYDAALALVIASVSDGIRAFCGCDLELGTYREVLDGEFLDRLFVTQRPVLSVHALRCNGRDILQASDLTGSGYVVQPWGVKVRGPIILPGVGNVEIRYQAGFDPIPFAVRDAAVQQSLIEWRRRPNQEQLTQAVGQASTSYERIDLYPGIQRQLLPYKRVAQC